MMLHLVEGAEGGAFARERRSVAIVVDTLRASSTAAMLFEAGASEIIAVRTVDQALALKRTMPDALLFGERGGLSPEGFDAGNSPRGIAGVRGRSVIFTTTTGTTRVLDAAGALAVYMGAPGNALAVAQCALTHGADVVLIPAGNAGDPEFDAHEDWAGAAVIASLVEAPIGEGARRYRETRHLLELDGLAGRLAASPHADKLRALGLADDVTFCAQMNVTNAVPMLAELHDEIAILRNAASQ